VKSSILCYFIAVILKVLLVNLLAALNSANVFLNKKNARKRCFTSMILSTLGRLCDYDF